MDGARRPDATRDFRAPGRRAARGRGDRPRAPCQPPCGFPASEGAEAGGSGRRPSRGQPPHLSGQPRRGGGLARLPRPVMEPRLDRLQGRGRATRRGGLMTMQATATSVRESIVVEAPVERAFTVFTEDIGSWWPPEHHILEAELAEMVFEPRAGGHVYDRGVDGSECRWARVLAYEPPNRVVFSWDIDLRWQIEADPDRTSEVEVRFIPEGADRTRVELEHRNIDRHGDGWERMRDAVGSPDGWLIGLERLAQRLDS